MRLSKAVHMRREPLKGMTRLVITLQCVTGVLANALSLFNPLHEAPVSVYNAGATNAVTTYLLGYNASASATGRCEFTAPITMIEGLSTFNVEVTTWLATNKTQSFTLDCPSGTTDQCDMTAMNSTWQTTTISLSPSNFSSYAIAIPTVASPQALLYNGVSLPTTLATPNISSRTIATSSISSTSSESRISITSPANSFASPVSTSSHLPSSKAKNYTWIAGAVIAPLSTALLIIAALFSRQKEMGVELEKLDDATGEIYGRAELHGDSLVGSTVQWDGRARSELPAREPAAAELF